MQGSDPRPSDHPGQNEIRKLLAEVLARDYVLLYDATGKPVLKNSDLWRAAEPEWRAATQRLIEQFLHTVQLQSRPSPDELVAALKTFVQTDPKYTLDMVDGKLSLPNTIRVGNVTIKSHIPLYRLATIIAGAWAGTWLLQRRETKPSVPPTTNLRPNVPRTWRTITVGTHRSSGDLLVALESAGCWISTGARSMINKVMVAERKAEIDLVTISPRNLWAETIPPDYFFTLDQVFALAGTHGLYAVPAEVGLQLRLQYPEQPDNEVLIIGMNPLLVEASDDNDTFWGLLVDGSIISPAKGAFVVESAQTRSGTVRKALCAVDMERQVFIPWRAEQPWVFGRQPPDFGHHPHELFKLPLPR